MMNFEDIIKDLKKEAYAPIYFLMGEEPYFIDVITKHIHDHVLTEDEKTFNQTVLYGKDTDTSAIVDISRRYPMMAKYQVVIIKEAQNLKKLEELIPYTKQPQKSTILVFNYKYKKLAKNTKIYKALEKEAIIFESKKLYDSKIPNWVTKYIKHKKCSIAPEAAALIAENLGNDLSKIANELEKLIITLPEGTQKITAEHIEKNIGISKDFNNFELQKAISQRNIIKANKIISHFAKNPKSNPFVLTINSLYFYFSKLLKFHFLKDKSPGSVASHLKINPYFVKEYQQAARNYPTKKVVQIISILREYDMKSKGVGSLSAPEGDLLKELIYKIMH
jgi:DNA polymerase-3 subunit delta